jgi:hypothetical protein
VDECFEGISTPKPGHKRAVNTTNIWHLREEFYAEVEVAHGRAAIDAAEHALERAVTCYAAKLHLNKGDYCKEVAGMSRVHAHRLMQAARISTMVAETLPVGNTGSPVLPQSESQVRHLTKLNDQDQQVRAWQAASEKAGGVPTEHEVLEAVVEILEPEKPPKPAEGRAARRKRLLGSLRAAVEKRSWKAVEKVLGELEMGL